MSTIRELNQKTSIVLGYHGLDYRTTSEKLQNDRYSKVETLTKEEIENARKARDDLRATHFSLGNNVTDYATSNTQLDPTGNMEKYTAKLDLKAKSMLRKTSAVLGYDSPNYETSTDAGTKWDKDSMAQSMAMRKDNLKFQDPRAVNYKLGNSKTDYTSTMKSSFVYDRSLVQSAEIAEEVKQDLRKCHYTLGNFKMDYSTSNKMPELDHEYLKNSSNRAKPATDPWKTSVVLSHEE